MTAAISIVYLACVRPTVVKWDWQQPAEFMASRPELRAELLTLVSTDLAAELRQITFAVSSLAMEWPAVGQSGRQIFQPAASAS